MDSILTFFALGFIVCAVLLFTKITVPYGKFSSNSWGRAALNAKVGWVLMEGFASLYFFVCLIQTKLAGKLTIAHIVFFCLWQFHYFYRAFLYPIFTPHRKKMPLVMMSMGLFFQLFNAFFQAQWIFNFGAQNYENSYLLTPQCLIGIILFFAGTYINRQSDFILRSLRKSSQADYSIPHGGLFTFLSCPNYFGEMLLWLGWAIMLWSPVGLSFFVWTIANLLPRALTTHQWYTEHFTDYPKNRKAVIPFLL